MKSVVIHRDAAAVIEHLRDVPDEWVLSQLAESFRGGVRDTPVNEPNVVATLVQLGVHPKVAKCKIRKLIRKGLITNAAFRLVLTQKALTKMHVAHYA